MKIQRAIRGARTPPAHRIAQADDARRQAKTPRVASDGGFDVAPCLALRKSRTRRCICSRAPRRRGRMPEHLPHRGHCHGKLLTPHDAALVWHVQQNMIDAPQRRYGAVFKWYDRRQSLRRATIHAAWRSAKARASRSEPRCGMVSTASRAANRTRKVKRLALGSASA